MRSFTSQWDVFKERIKNKVIYLFLDYDGTLVPIKNTPAEALLSPQTRKLLKALSANRYFKVAIISGRSLKDLKKLIRIKGLIYVGNHGLEIEGPRMKYTNLILPRTRKVLDKIHDSLKAKLSVVKGAFIEDKGASLTVHYRLAAPEAISTIKTLLYETTIRHEVRGEVRIGSGKMVLEVRPLPGMDKGKIVLWLLARQKFVSGKKKTCPVYIGDDVTDEDAFRALRGRGVTVRVGREKGSCAGYYLDGQKDVLRLLESMKDLNIR